MDLEVLWKSFRGRGAWVGVIGFVFPMILGILVGMAFGLDVGRTVFIGLCIAITALLVSVRILMGLDIGPGLFTILVLMAVVTTLATPLLLKKAYDRMLQRVGGALPDASFSTGVESVRIR